MSKRPQGLPAEIHREILACGWTHHKTKRHHIYRPPSGMPEAPAQIVVSASASDWRANKNVLSLFRKFGVKV